MGGLSERGDGRADESDGEREGMSRALLRWDFIKTSILRSSKMGLGLSEALNLHLLQDTDDAGVHWLRIIGKHFDNRNSTST